MSLLPSRARLALLLIVAASMAIPVNFASADEIKFMRDPHIGQSSSQDADT